MKNVVAYLRVSTDNQVGEDKYGLESQKRDVVEYCSQNNMTIIDWFIEEGVSGAKLDRPQLNRLLSSEVLNPPVEAVVVPKTDRVARDINLYYFIKYGLKKKNIELISVQDDYSAYGPMGNIMESIIVSFAEFEKNMITSRTTKGRTLKAAKGGYSGGKPPYGYDVKDGSLIINHEEATVVVSIFQLRETGSSLQTISNLLNDNDCTTKSGAKWYPAQIGYIVNNFKFYEGLYKYSDDEWVQGQHEAIL